MAIDAGKLRILGVDVNEIMAFGVDLFERFAAALSKNEMTRSTITGFDRHLAIGCHMFAIVATEASVPILVTDEIGMRPPKLTFTSGKNSRDRSPAPR